MRWIAIIGAGFALMCSAAPASAQYAAPYAAPGMWGAPELANGAIGAGAASSAATQTYCSNVGVGRDGPRGQCQPAPTEEGRSRR